MITAVKLAEVGLYILFNLNWIDVISWGDQKKDVSRVSLLGRIRVSEKSRTGIVRRGNKRIIVSLKLILNISLEAREAT